MNMSVNVGLVNYTYHICGFSRHGVNGCGGRHTCLNSIHGCWGSHSWLEGCCGLDHRFYCWCWLEGCCGLDHRFHCWCWLGLGEKTTISTYSYFRYKILSSYSPKLVWIFWTSMKDYFNLFCDTWMKSCLIGIHTTYIFYM